MKVLIPLLALTFVLVQPCRAQFSVQSDKGNVTIGTDGTINVQGAPGQNGGNVRITPSGIDVQKDGQNVKIRQGGITGSSTTIKSGGITTARSGSATTVRRPGASATVTAAVNMADQVSAIEMSVYGHKNANLPLVARVEKLETDNLGKKGTGTVRQRIDILADTLGVSLSTSSSSAPKQAVTVKTNAGSPATQVNVAAAGGPDITFNQNNESQVLTCNGQNVAVNGNHCNLSLKGHCKSLVLNGNNNVVRADLLDQVVANGNNNSAVWPKSVSPAIVNNGSGNSLQPQ